MLQRFLLSLLLVCAILTLAKEPNTQLKGPKGVAPRPRTGREVIRSRQITRAKLDKLRERRNLIKKGMLQPRASAKIYPQCSVGSAAGFARIAN